MCYNPHPEEGISSSLKIGLKENKETDACLFTVSDQPWLTWESVRGLLEIFWESEKGMACMQNGEKKGNPCVFSKKYYKELFFSDGRCGRKADFKCASDRYCCVSDKRRKRIGRHRLYG